MKDPRQRLDPHADPTTDPQVRGETGLAAVLGRPISHSLSPVLHRAAYRELGLTGWSYDAVECDESGFAGWFAGLGPEWRGLSLTMPLKQVVLPLLTSISPLAQIVGAVNTVTWDADRQPVGHNTDVLGIVEALRSAGVSGVSSACILGAGATAASAVAALAELGCGQLLLQARSAARAVAPLAVAEKLGITAVVAGLDQLEAALAADVVISTLPAAAAAEWADRLALFTSAPRPVLTAGPARADRSSVAGVLLDVTYHPWPTPSAGAWSSAGGMAVGGFEMLLHQAAAQVTLMTGLPAPLPAMRVAGEKALTDRH